MNHLPVMAVLIPLLSAFVASLIAIARPRLTGVCWFAGASAHAAVLMITAYTALTEGGMSYAVGAWAAPVGIVLVVDAFAAFFLIIIAIGHAACALFALCEGRAERPTYGVLVLLLNTAITGIALAGDLFNLFVFLELATVCTTSLIALKRRDAVAVRGFIYLVYASLSGMLFLVGVVVLYVNSGVLTIAGIGAVIDRLPRAAVAVSAGCFIVSFGIKFALVPLHLWQAPAYESAGSTTSALLSGTAMNLYLCGLLRLLWHALRVAEVLPGLFPALLVAGMINIAVGHTAALSEPEGKRLLAYSGVAHVGYILVGIASVRPGAAAGENAIILGAALIHLLMHSITKTTLFFGFRRITARFRSSALRDWRGAASAEPVAFAALCGVALAIVGIPPTLGFASKWLISVAALQTYGLFPVIVIAGGTVVSMIYYARVATWALAPGPESLAPATEVSRFAPLRVVPPVLMLAGAAAALLLGVTVSRLLPWATEAGLALADFATYQALVAGGV